MARNGWLPVLTVASAVSIVCADLAETYPMSEVLDWEIDAQMQLSIMSDGDPLPIIYAVIPLTADLGLNESQTDRGKINIQGKLALADASTYAGISGADVIPYMSCDAMNNSFINPNEILNQLMSNSPQPQAIILYSQENQCCGLAGQNLNFHKLLTMPDNRVASQLSNLTSSATSTVQATITGNLTDMQQDQDDQQTGSNSAVAMSILYSITGLITLLFLVIIATGAIRAHRYPERYGPRSGFGGRSRQSRAKGLARAVLETLPIIKFGETQTAKPDPNAELENIPPHPTSTTEAGREVPQDGSERHLSTIPESPSQPVSNLEDRGALSAHHGGSTRAADDSAGESAGEGNSNVPHANMGNDDALGCSICTDDFTVGEDVRVLPCNHKFHPSCVDPWLVNVSGTCPLCRLDLRPEHDEAVEVGVENTDAPPLGADANEAGDSSNSISISISNSSRRRSRFFDLARLRHATVEERIEVLRRIRIEQQSGSTASNEEDRQGRAKLSDRLRDRFRVKTRAAQRSLERTVSTSAAPPGTSQRGTS